MSLSLLPKFIREHYEVRQWRHACAILHDDFPEEWGHLVTVLTSFRFHRSEILKPGGRKSSISEKIDRAFARLGWKAKRFDTQVVIDGKAVDNPTHEIDCYRNRVALEIEWNNKDPFFDRDLSNFRVLFDLRAISVGVIITRTDELQALFLSLGKKIAEKYGASTTHMSKLRPRVDGGGGGGCPVLVFGITKKLYVED